MTGLAQDAPLWQRQIEEILAQSEPKWLREIYELPAVKSFGIPAGIELLLQQFNSLSSDYFAGFKHMWQGWNIEGGDYEPRQFYQRTQKEASQLMAMATAIFEQITSAQQENQARPSLSLKQLVHYLNSVTNLLTCFKGMRLRVEAAGLEELATAAQALKEKTNGHITGTYGHYMAQNMAQDLLE